MTRERAPKPGVTWGTELIPVEVLADDGEWVEIGGVDSVEIHAEPEPGDGERFRVPSRLEFVTDPPPPPMPEPYRPNRADRRAQARARRRKT